MIFDDQGRSLWSRRRDRDMWNLPANTSLKQVERVRDALQNAPQPIFRMQTGPSSGALFPAS